MSAPPPEGPNHYWNRDAVVREFAELEPPTYWRAFFEQHAGTLRRVLDLGCGGGRNSVMLGELGYHVDACDLSEKMVRATLRRLAQLPAGLGEARVIRVDMLALPYADAAFDAVLANGVLHNVASVEQLARAVAEIRRALRVGGFLCLNMFTSARVDPRLTRDAPGDAYRTADGLDLLLLPTPRICELLELRGLERTGPVVEYERELTVGVRSVMRGVFIRRE